MTTNLALVVALVVIGVVTILQTFSNGLPKVVRVSCLVTCFYENDAYAFFVRSQKLREVIQNNRKLNRH